MSSVYLERVTQPIDNLIYVIIYKIGCCYLFVRQSHPALVENAGGQPASSLEHLVSPSFGCFRSSIQYWQYPSEHEMIAERIGFLGGGKIAQAMAKGFISSGVYSVIPYNNSF